MAESEKVAGWSKKRNCWLVQVVVTEHKHAGQTVGWTVESKHVAVPQTSGATEERALRLMHDQIVKKVLECQNGKPVQRFQIESISCFLGPKDVCKLRWLFVRHPEFKDPTQSPGTPNTKGPSDEPEPKVG